MTKRSKVLDLILEKPIWASLRYVCTKAFEEKQNKLVINIAETHQFKRHSALSW